MVVQLKGSELIFRDLGIVVILWCCGYVYEGWLFCDEIYPIMLRYPWWSQGMETSSLLLALCVGKPPITRLFSSQTATELNPAWTNSRVADDLRHHDSHMTSLQWIIHVRIYNHPGLRIPKTQLDVVLSISHTGANYTRTYIPVWFELCKHPCVTYLSSGMPLMAPLKNEEHCLKLEYIMIYICIDCKWCNKEIYG